MPAEFFIHLKTRRAQVAGMTPVPNGDWMAQQARNLSMYFAEQGEAKPTHIIRERDTKFTEQFCSILESDGIKFKPIPPRSPNLNPFAERWIQSVIRECLDHFIVFGEAHLRYLIDSYLDWYHCFRPHQRLNNLRIGVDKPPDPVESLNQRARTSNLRSRRRQAGFCNGLAGLVVTSKRNDRGAHSGAREFAT